MVVVDTLTPTEIALFSPAPPIYGPAFMCNHAGKNPEVCSCTGDCHCQGNVCAKKSWVRSHVVKTLLRTFAHGPITRLQLLGHSLMFDHIHTESVDGHLDHLMGFDRVRVNKKGALYSVDELENEAENDRDMGIVVKALRTPRKVDVLCQVLNEQGIHPSDHIELLRQLLSREKVIRTPEGMLGLAGKKNAKPKVEKPAPKTRFDLIGID
jgi:hypothetical protein